MTTPLGSSSRASSSGTLDQSQTSVSVSVSVADLPITPNLALLRRRDVEVGEVLGRGRYSEVNAIAKIHPCATSTNNLPVNGRYVMKHIQNKLFAYRSHRRVARDLTNAIADLVTEAMYLSKLRHPHIVQLRGLTKGGTSALKRSKACGEDYFLVLDRMEETLGYRIDQRWRKQTPTQSLLLTKTRYAWQMANVLNYLHNHHIIYRDFKPCNIGFVLQDESLPMGDFNRDRLQLFDFGLARELPEPPPPLHSDEPERLYTLSASGTRRYMAVEIFNDKGKYNYKADVYSWSIVFYECLAHAKPFSDFTTQSHEELVCRLGGRPRFKDIRWPKEDCDELRSDLEKLMMDAWNQKWSRRPSMAQVQQRVEEILERHGIRMTEEDYLEDDAQEGLEASTHSSIRQAQQQQHFFANDPDAVLFLKKKTSTSELTVATDPVASDSEVDDDHPKARCSQNSNGSGSHRSSSVSSLGSMPRNY